MSRASLLALFSSLLAAALWISCSDAPEPVATDAALPDRVEQIADGVWFRQGDLDDKGHCNNVIIEMEDGLVVIDANFPSGAKLVMDAVAQISDKPVRWVFDTHHHGDHAYGNPLWTRAGATTLAYVGVAEEIRRYEPESWQAAMEEREDVAAVGLDTLEPPQQTFSESPYVIEDATRRIEFHHFGWAHTRGDGFAFLPNERILASGDAILNGPYNFTGQGNTGNWPNVIRAAMELDFDTILPGHGPAGGREIAEGQLSFFEQINAQVEEAFEAGMPLEEIVTVEDGAGVATTLDVSADVQNWKGDRFPEQVRVRYAELEAGKPHGAIVGGE